MSYSLLLEKNIILNDLKKTNKIIFFFFENYFDFLKDENERISFLDIIDIEQTRLDNIYINYQKTNNNSLKRYLLNLPKIKYEEIVNKKIILFKNETLESHNWNQLSYIAHVKKNIPIYKYNKEIQLIYKIYKDKKYEVREIKNLINENDIDIDNLNQKDLDFIILNLNY